MKKLPQSNKGFSLVELMVVVAIIGILAALAVPRFTVFQVKARQSEAKTNLSQIFTLEMSYMGEWDEFVAFDGPTPTNIGGSGDENCPSNPIGFSPTPCSKARYQYNVTSEDKSVFEGTAESGEGADNVVNRGKRADKWKIDETKILSHTQNTLTD